jgi:long-chain acyl-CoA synthetase
VNRSQHLFARAAEHPAKTALIFGDDSISYEDLAQSVRSLAAQLHRLGLRQHDRVGVMLPNAPDFIVTQQAVFLLGAVFSPLNIYYLPNEIAHAVDSCALSWLVLPPELIERVPVFRDGTAPFILVLDEDGMPARLGDQPDARDEAPVQPASVAPEDVVMLLHTSATTGKSKGVMLTAANLAANYDRTPGWLGLKSDTVILCALPLYNTFGLNQGINALLLLGATMVLQPRFKAQRCVEAIQAHRCTFLPAVPTMLQRIYDEPLVERWGLPSLTRIMTGGAPVPASLLQRVEAASGEDTQLFTGYGLTEGTALVTLTRVELNADGEVRRPRTIGRVLDGMSLAILDPDGAEVANGEIGEICLRGPNVMTGYFRAPKDTAQALAGGWLHSGDLGIRDSDGFVSIVDRLKDVIIRGGQNIYPADIEEVLYTCQDVAEAAVVRRLDPDMGEVPVAFVAPKIGHRILVSGLVERCRATLAPFKQPVEITVLAELPKGPTGKILRRQLRDEAQGAA